MNRRKALAGLSLICALAFCAIAAPSAFAETEGTTAVTCVKGATADYKDAHCDNTSTPAAGEFGHKALGGTTTAVVGSNLSTKNETKEREVAVLTTTAGGLETEIKCNIVASTGNLENALSGEIHKIIGSAIFITYEECAVPKPAGQECKIPGGKIVTKSLRSESKVVEGVHRQLFIPTEKTEGKDRFVTITFEGCKTAGLNKGYNVEGSVNAEPSGSDGTKSSGSTVIVNLPKNAASTLEFGMQKAGLKQVETLRMSGEGGEPIATTNAPYTVK